MSLCKEPNKKPKLVLPGGPLTGRLALHKTRPGLGVRRMHRQEQQPGLGLVAFDIPSTGLQPSSSAAEPVLKGSSRTGKGKVGRKVGHAWVTPVPEIKLSLVVRIRERSGKIGTFPSLTSFGS